MELLHSSVGFEDALVAMDNNNGYCYYCYYCCYCYRIIIIITTTTDGFLSFNELVRWVEEQFKKLGYINNIN